MGWIFCCLALLATLPGDDDLARTTRIVQPEVRRAFYRSGGRYLLGKKVHLHVESSVLRKVPRSYPTRGKGMLLVFDNRSVPVVIFDRSPYWIQAARHLSDAGEMCLRGSLRVPDWDPRQRIHLMVTKIQRAPGTWR